MTGQKYDYESELISIVAHDLKVPVSAAKGFVELLPHVGPLNEQQQHFVTRTMEALGRMQDLITDLLDFARIESGVSLEPTEVDLRVLMDSALALLEAIIAQRDITVQVEFEPGTVIVHVDEHFMNHVVNNLLSNAIKYNNDGGQVWVTAVVRDDKVQIDVRDNGKGIPVEDQPRVFERFYRARQEQESRIDGSGLGLAITESVVRMHGGDIWLESSPGQGSTFSFTLPLRPLDGSSGKYARTTKRQRTDSLMHVFSEIAGEQSDDVDDSTQEPDDLSISDSQDEVPGSS
jgi:two-component system, OmpR family, phosphate regulon sensor histidine kinase PhoR